MTAKSDSPFVEAVRQEVRRLKIGRAWTTTTFAEELGVSESTVKRWRLTNRLVPTRHVKVGRTRVNLYTPADLKRGREIVASYPRSRPRDQEET